MILVSAAALLDETGRILMQKRPEGDPHAGLWEFPGGKVEEREHPLDALYRECAEELGIVLDIDVSVPVGFSYVDRIESSPILILLYVCRRWSGVPAPVFASELKWTGLEDLQSLELVPADVTLCIQLRAALSQTRRLGPS